MKNLVLVTVSLLMAQASFAYEVQVCTAASPCQVMAPTVKKLNEGKGLSGCGVIAGEKIVKFVTEQGAVLGYSCIWGNTPGQ